MNFYFEMNELNIYYLGAAMLCAVAACLTALPLTAGPAFSLRLLFGRERFPLLLLVGFFLGGNQFFGIRSILTDSYPSTTLFALFFPLAAGMSICLLSLRLSSREHVGALYSLGGALALTLLIIVIDYSNIYMNFGQVDWRLEPLLMAFIGLFCVLFPLLRLLSLITRRKGRMLERFPIPGLLFCALAITSMAPVLAMSALPPDPQLAPLSMSDGQIPYILLFAIAAGLFILTDRYREADAIKQFQQIREKETHYMSLFSNNPDAVIALNEHGKLSDMNDRARELLKSLPGGVPNGLSDEWLPEGQKKKLQAHFGKVLSGFSDEIEIELIEAEGNVMHLILTSQPILIEGRFTGSYSIAKDVTESKTTQEKIRHLAYHDDLTGLTNRKYVRECVENLTASAAVKPFNLFFIDFDRFKKVNDLFGHEFGDKVIRRSAHKLQNALPEDALLSRSTADEFIAIIPSEFDAIYAAQRIGDEFSLPFRIGQQMVNLSASIGIARFPEDGIDAEALFKNADLARFDAQSRGGGRFAFFDHDRAAENHERLILERDLQAAIEHGNLVLFYQPKVDTRTGGIVGLEALVRWKHPTLGMVPPLKFISIAEESGLIVPLERWVLRTACIQMQNWISEGRPPIPVAVNLSQIHLMQSNIVENVLATLEDLNFDTRLLELEVTESAMMHNEEQVIAILRQFKQAGIAVSLDDFGTGYSSLSYLHSLPIDCLKIDRSFIKGITTNENSRAIVEMILTMARQLGLRIIAEGIEHEEQAELLRELQCFTAQGFYYSKPVPADDVYASHKLSS